MIRFFTLLLFLLGLLGFRALPAQDGPHHKQAIRKLYSRALQDQQGYHWLAELVAEGPRFAGTAQADSAVFQLQRRCDSLGLETQLQPVTVPRWDRGPQEVAYFEAGGQMFPLQTTALGGSVPTPTEGLSAAVVEIQDWDQLDSLDLEGKIAFYNIPMDPSYINTFFAYSEAVKQRFLGAVKASKQGARAVIIRSLSSSINKFPHTGSMTYQGAQEKIPAAAISTWDAERLHRALDTSRQELEVHLRMQCHWEDSVTSYNLIADWPGTQFPDKYLLSGGHLDSWDLGTGAHDDGAGVMHALDAFYLLKKSGLRLKRSLRLVFFMNEEFGLSGAKAYGQMAREQDLHHVAAIESDAGGFSPRGISIVAPDSLVESIRSWRSLLEPYGIHRFSQGYAGADINQLPGDETILIGLRPDSHRYFEVHHSARDVLAQVNARELEMGSATLASLLYLLDYYDLGDPL